MAKRKIYLGPIDQSLQGALYAAPALVVDAFNAGDLLEQTTSGYQTSSIAATVFDSVTLIAEEIPETEGGNIDTAYTVGDSVEPIILRSGEFAHVRVAANQNITVRNTALSSNGDGTLKIAVTDGTEQVLFYADEVINTGANVERVRVRKA